VPALSRAGGAPGISPFGVFPSRKVPAAFPQQMNPHAVSPGGTADTEVPTRSARPRLLGFDPSESSSRPTGVWHAETPGTPLGFIPSRAFPQQPCRDPSRTPLTRFAEPAPQDRSHRRPRVSIGRRLASPALTSEPASLGETTLLGFPHRSVPDHSDAGSFGLCIHLAPRHTSLPTAGAL
jgi:hypothetical protein